MIQDKGFLPIRHRKNPIPSAPGPLRQYESLLKNTILKGAPLYEATSYRETMAPEPRSMSLLQAVRSKRVLLVFAMVTLLSSLSAQTVTSRITATSKSSHGPLALRRIVEELRTPWAFAPLPSGAALISERPGRLLYLTSLVPNAGKISEVQGVPHVAPIGQGGLLDVVVSPRYLSDRAVYLSYAARTTDGLVTRVARATLTEGPEARLSGVTPLFELNNPTSGGVHFGSRLAFDREGNLYITVGDRGERAAAQDTSVHNGSVVRLREGSYDPYPARGLSSAAEGLFSYGHRNAQGIARDPVTGMMWLHEHGPRGGDEINILVEGANYGWPRVTGWSELLRSYDRRSGIAPGNACASDRMDTLDRSIRDGIRGKRSLPRVAKRPSCWSTRAATPPLHRPERRT